MQTAVATSIARSPACAARKAPATGPTTQPSVSAIRTMETTPSAAGVGAAASSSWIAANSWEVAAPANPSTTALITNGIHSAPEKAIASQPRNPAAAQIRNRPSRRPVRSDRRPIRYPATGAVRLVR